MAKSRQNPKVIWIEDDLFTLSNMTSLLSHEGIDVISASNYYEAKKVIERHGANVAAIIIDVMLQLGEKGDRVSEDVVLLTKAGHEAGLVLNNWIISQFPNVPRIVVSAMEPERYANYREDGTLWLSKYDSSYNIIDAISRIVKKTSIKKSIHTFIVHGHDETTKLKVKNYLQNTLQLPEPIILHEQANRGRTIMEKFEAAAREINLVVVIMTPDDKVSMGEPEATRYRTRQNVIFEMGYFLGKLRRKSGRLILLHKGGLELPSDLQGVVYIDISNGIDAAGEEIRKEVNAIFPKSLN